MSQQGGAAAAQPRRAAGSPSTGEAGERSSLAAGIAELRVGRFAYLNAWPFRAGWRGPAPCWIEAPPRRLGDWAAAGRLDAACLASRDALALADRVRPLGDLGIACRGAVSSVLLLSTVPIEELGGRPVALTRESRTSRGLLRVLLRERFGVEPRYTEKIRGSSARLVIGDAALAARRAAPWPFVLDLGEAWSKWTDLPFVWARWVVRRDLPASRAGALADALADSLGTSLAEPPRVAGAPLPPGLSHTGARRYLERFRYRLGPAEEAGLLRFRQELETHDLLDHHSRRRPLGPAPV